MFFFRCCNQNIQCRQNRPPACKTAEVLPKPEPSVLFKSVSAGGVIITGFAGAEKAYDLIQLNLEIPPQKQISAALNFACNLTLINAMVDIRFQMVKSGVNLLFPLASPVIYRRTAGFTGADTICFNVCDTVPARSCSCNYLMKMYIKGNIPTEGMLAVTNPVLTAVFYE